MGSGLPWQGYGMGLGLLQWGGMGLCLQRQGNRGEVALDSNCQGGMGSGLK